MEIVIKSHKLSQIVVTFFAVTFPPRLLLAFSEQCSPEDRGYVARVCVCVCV